ncbi:hypothetical protein NBE98_01770 [Clostridium swellfunianum]|uniref:hypothetical protein n=1 Tax=Clostridium swellfunianum TaxID=1367462 RepID=UPI00202FEFE3|nr:hypothetical protein [Clostridium swellfunianum]MCM0647098.1 hypothetical protein [Clostridium swellfunianum]
MSTYGKQEKVCATCIYWKGKRGVEFEYIEARDEQGKCGCDDGFCDINTMDACSCSDWKGFPVVKNQYFYGIGSMQ